MTERQVTVRFTEDTAWIPETLEVLAAKKRGMGFKASMNSEIIRLLREKLLELTTGDVVDREILKGSPDADT